jgi:predicted transcriptional regulator
MQPLKKGAINTIQQLIDNADTEEMIYRLYVLDKIRHGQQDAAEGKTQTAEEVLKDFQTW